MFHRQAYNVLYTMLNRRHLRIKALQTLYAYHQAENKDLKAFEKQLLQQVDRVYENYLQLLLLLVEISLHTDVDARERAEKHIPSADDLNANTRLLHNRFIQQILKNDQYLADSKKHKISWQGEASLIRQLFLDLRKKKEYEEYCVGPDSYEADLEIAQFILKKVIAKSVMVEQYFEERNLNWATDRNVVFSMVNRMFKTFTEKTGSNHPLAEIAPNWEDDKAFYVTLFRETALNDLEYQQYIAEKTKNWEVDRIAMMDILLMKMAICEWIHFSSIPVKVSINEYIDISKDYSTPNSKGFINGILDKLVLDLKKANKIRKTGRGLME